MLHLATERQFESGGRIEFDPRVRLEFHGSNLTSDGALLFYH